MRDERKILSYMDLGFYLVFVPIIVALLPTDKIVERDPRFLLLMFFYMVIVHTINRRLNFITYLFKGEHQKAIFTIVAVVAITYIASRIKINDFRDISGSITLEDVRRMRNKVLSTLFFIDVSFTVMMGLMLEIFRQRLETQTIEAEKGKAELALYKSQINPHFMFNTLNTIYALNLTGSQLTSEVIMKFSNIVKYMYQNSDKEMIMISEEVKYLHEFIDLHTLRLSENTKVRFTHEVDDGSESIPSMIFITFVENLFKYGVSSAEQSTIEIELSLKRKFLRFSTSNTIFSRGDDSSGIGIENCRKRLSLLYPERYSLECRERDNIYTTTLEINL